MVTRRFIFQHLGSKLPGAARANRQHGAFHHPATTDGCEQRQDNLLPATYNNNVFEDIRYKQFRTVTMQKIEAGGVQEL